MKLDSIHRGLSISYTEELTSRPRVYLYSSERGVVEEACTKIGKSPKTVEWNNANKCFVATVVQKSQRMQAISLFGKK